MSLDADHVATLDIPSAPAAVAGARRFAADTLTAWNLDDLSFTTELIVSELVTNAIRYGKSPIHLRMILQSTLTCEVFDANSTTPHLRRGRPRTVPRRPARQALGHTAQPRGKSDLDRTGPARGRSFRCL